MVGDVERVRAALRAGAQPVQVYGRDSVTKRSLRPDTIAHGPDGDVLILMRYGRVTRLGRIWDEQRGVEHSRSQCVQRGEKQVPSEGKGAITGIPTYAPDP